MKKIFLLILIGTCLGLPNINLQAQENIIKLPKVVSFKNKSLFYTMVSRRSRRAFEKRALTLEELSAIAFSAQGITDDTGKRTAPSARATYPISLYLLIRDVEGLETGIYTYDPENHSIVLQREVFFEDEIKSQNTVETAPLVVAITSGEPKKQIAENKERTANFISIEAGHIGQNIYLAAEALNLATVGVGGFSEKNFAEVLGLDENHKVLYLMPVGARKE